jgi:hypothetical protein
MLYGRKRRRFFRIAEVINVITKLTERTLAVFAQTWIDSLAWTAWYWSILTDIKIGRCRYKRADFFRELVHFQCLDATKTPWNSCGTNTNVFTYRNREVTHD